jgi:hypothetical protein
VSKKRTKEAIAYHEAGHAVIARVLGIGVTHVALTDGNPGLRTLWGDYYEAHSVPARIAALERHAKVSFAGQIAQVRQRAHTDAEVRRQGKGWSTDWRNADNYTAMAVSLKKGIEPVPGTAFDSAIAAEADVLENRLLAETMILVEQNWPGIERVAKGLLRRSFLTGDDIDALIANHQVPAA